jgi:phosphate/sulfate permease
MALPPRGLLPKRLDLEHIMNYVLLLFRGREFQMFRSVVEEAAAIASLALFLGMIAIWARIIATLGQVPEAWG